MLKNGSENGSSNAQKMVFANFRWPYRQRQALESVGYDIFVYKEWDTVGISSDLMF